MGFSEKRPSIIFNLNADIAFVQLQDHSASGDIDFCVAGENLAQFETCYLKNDGKLWKAQGDAYATTEGTLAMALEAISADDTGAFILCGWVRDDTWTWTVGGRIYVSPSTAGVITQTVPASGEQIRKVGFAYSAAIIWFGPSDNIIELV